MSRLQQIFKERILVLDGAMGTAIQALDLSAADFDGEEFDGCNEILNLTRPDAIESIHHCHLEAGADIIETNTFGATSVAQADYAMESVVVEMNPIPCLAQYLWKSSLYCLIVAS